MKCIECRFWRRADAAEPVSGECHRHAPNPISEALAVIMGAQRNAAEGVTDDTVGAWTDRIALWPRTFAGDFCGEASPIETRRGFV